MKPQSIIIFTLSTFLIGFMLAVQFQTMKHPDEEREKRSVWDLREELEKEKQKQVQLNTEISQYEILLNEYQRNSKKERLIAMEEARDKLKTQAGLTAISGRGIVFTIEPLFHEELLGEETPKLSVELLGRMINQLNVFGVEHILIGDERVMPQTAIREVNGEIFVNNRPLPELPLHVKVVSKDVAKLYDQFKVSKLKDEFANENLSITAEIKNKIDIIPYDRSLRVKYMEPYKED